ncbi:hypothetical protein BS50DRAFT_31846 [Corynespora cassiicola Philippines]|uniref:Uncharacterized protein n=1 Tax=Corynespora cassiicola Philippines TaxID=1448308 RepID=A0A2T2PBN2_CORCC|nr:hypothetical protein BS50DRAFT_31846 [Corynespora cassiicola Philippines]
MRMGWEWVSDRAVVPSFRAAAGLRRAEAGRVVWRLSSGWGAMMHPCRQAHAAEMPRIARRVIEGTKLLAGHRDSEPSNTPRSPIFTARPSLYTHSPSTVLRLQSD